MNGSEGLLSREELREKFGVVNYLVLFVVLAVSALIGVFYWWRGNKTTEDFLLASRSMSTGQPKNIIQIQQLTCDKSS